MTHTRGDTGGGLSNVNTQNSLESQQLLPKTFSKVSWYFETSREGRGFDSLQKDFQTDAQGWL